MNTLLMPPCVTHNKVLPLSTKVTGDLLPRAVPIKDEDNEFLIWATDPQLTTLSGLRGDSSRTCVQGVYAEATLILNRWGKRTSLGKQVTGEINCKQIY